MMTLVINTAFLWVSITPFGKPVVPLEYKMKTTSSGLFLTRVYVLDDKTRSENCKQGNRAISGVLFESKTMILHVEGAVFLTL